MTRSISRAGAAFGAALFVIALSAAPALACGGLIGPNGAVNLLRTTTLAGYHDGEEHYITAFQFAGGGGSFGSLTPLPGIPSKVEKGGDWTLQRLVRETEPQRDWTFFAADGGPAAGTAEELMKVRIDALDITVLRGGPAEVGQWATDHGFRLPPDSPEVLDFYAARSPIFLAAVFDADAAAERGQAVGDGTPVHITIPTDNPWVPLRILALGKSAARARRGRRLPADRSRAGPAARTPTARTGLELGHSAAASESLLTDLRSDAGMEWVPSSGWLSKVRIDAARAADSSFDLAIDASGAGQPSRVMAGLDLPGAVARAGSVGGHAPDHRRRHVHGRRHRRDPVPAGPATAADRGLSEPRHGCHARTRASPAGAPRPGRRPRPRARAGRHRGRVGERAGWPESPSRSRSATRTSSGPW